MFIVVFIVTLLILVLIHEFGHYVMAKKFHIKVLEFGFGIPPRAWGKKVGETIYSLNWLPFGGFVRLLGEDEPGPEVTGKKESDTSRYFSVRPVWQRVTVVVAGVTMNLLLAWLIFYIVLAAQNYKVQLPLVSSYNFIGVHQSVEKMVVVGVVAPNSPAEEVGIKLGDRIIAVNDKFIKTSEELVTFTRSHRGEKIKLTISDIEQTSYRTVSVLAREDPPKGQGSLGVSLSTFEVANLQYKDLWQKLLSGPVHSVNLVGYSGKILSELIQQSIVKKDISPVSHTVAGPIGITAIVQDILEVKNPLIPYLNFLASLSLNLAIVNILPFPGLDGGRLLFLAIEGITRRRVHATLEKYIHTVGLALLLSLIILISVSDIGKLFT